MNDTIRLLDDEIYPELLVSGEGHRVIFGGLSDFSEKANYFLADCPDCGAKAHFQMPKSRPFGFCYNSNKCGYTVNWWNYLQGQQGLSNHQALMELAQLAGVKLDVAGNNGTSAAQVAKQHRKAALLEDFVVLGKGTFFSPEAADVLAYLKGRGYSEEEIKKAEFCFYPSRQDVEQYLLGKGYTTDEMKESGVFTLDFGEWYQLVIPYRDAIGRPTGLVGRLTDAQLIQLQREVDDLERNAPQNPQLAIKKQELINTVGADKKGEPNYKPKYKNTFGIDKDAPFNFCNAKANKSVLVLEGYFDSMILPLRGLDGVVAVGTAALSEAQLSTMLRYGVREIILSLDNDSAGLANTERAIKLINGMDEGVSAFVVEMKVHESSPDCKDPDEYVAKYGIAAYKELVEKAIVDVRWEANRILSKYDVKTDRGLMAAKREGLLFASGIDSKRAGMASVFLGTLAEGLGMDDSLLRLEFQTFDDSEQEVPPTLQDTLISLQEQEALNFMITNPTDETFLKLVQHHITADHFTKGMLYFKEENGKKKQVLVRTHDLIFDAVYSLYGDGVSIRESTILQRLAGMEEREYDGVDCKGKSLSLILSGTPVEFSTYVSHLEELQDRYSRCRSAEMFLEYSGRSAADVSTGLSTIQSEAIDDIASLQMESQNGFKTNDQISPAVLKSLTSTSSFPIPTSFSNLNVLLNGGLQRGKMYTITGGAGSGKTTFALQIVDEIADSNSIPAATLEEQAVGKPKVGVLYVAMEMSVGELITKSYSRLSGLNGALLESKAWLIGNGLFPDEICEIAQERLVEAAERYGEFERYILVLEGSNETRIGDVKSAVRWLKNKLPACALADRSADTVVVVIDPMQRLLFGDERIDSNDTTRISMVAASIKKLAIDLDVPVIALSDTTKEGRNMKDNGEGAFRGSYMINHVSDVTLYLNCDDNLLKAAGVSKDNLPQKEYQRHTQLEAKQNVNPLEKDKHSIYAVLHTSKQRTGAKRNVDFVYHRAINQFVEI